MLAVMCAMTLALGKKNVKVENFEFYLTSSLWMTAEYYNCLFHSVASM